MQASPLIPEGHGNNSHRPLKPLSTGPSLPTAPGSVQNSPIGISIPSTTNTFEGVNNIDGVLPPDTNGDVGPNNYVQWVNLHFEIWNRAGTSLMGPSPGNTLWSGFGGNCEFTNQGDPVVRHDAMADRWVFTQFAFVIRNGQPAAPFSQCFAVSTTSDPTGSYYRYEFVVSNTYFNDYPKLGIWPDAYYMSVNDFNGNSFAGGAALAFDRASMLSGQAARMISFGPLGPGYGGMLPSDLDGSILPTAGEPDYFGAIDTSVAPTGGTFQIWKFHIDWTTPTNSTFGTTSHAPDFALTVATYNWLLCNGSRNCISQKGTSVGVDPVSDRLMNRLQYRRFSDGHESLVANHTVRIGTGNQAGIRWYEIRNLSSTPTVFQQGTYAPSSDNRWMGSIGMDQVGDIALGYSLSSSIVFPSIEYTGRIPTDTPGLLPQGEGVLIAGGGSQTSGFSRWGDYSMMAVDPVDDCTFWYTNQYLTANGSFNWHTRVGSFRYPSCSLAASSTALTSTPNPSTGGPVTLTATVTGSGAAPTGTVTFQDGNTVLTSAAVSNGQATVNVGLLGGTRSLVAVYSGDTTYSGSSSAIVSQTVNLPSTATSLQSSAPAVYAGNPITLTATITGSSPTGTVTFTDSNLLTIGVSTVSGGSAGLTISGLAVGSHNITATYSGDTANAASASNTVSITVGGPTYSLAYSFTGGADSGAAQSGLTQAADGALYGVTDLQGSNTYGTVFRFTRSGGVTTLHIFAPADGGVSRSKLLIGADGALYGTSQTSSANTGTVWRITTQGAFSVLHTFNGNDGRDPAGGLVQDAAGNLYGLTVGGGSLNCGTAYSLSQTGTLTTLFSFTCGSDGNGPQGALTFGPDGNLYGVTLLGGAHNQGTVFRITTGGALTTLYSFNDSSDGALPQSGVLLGSDGNFYGTSSAGATGRGTIFRITPAGAFTTLYSLTPGDGSAPLSGLIQDTRGNFYGETAFTNPGNAFNQDGSIFEFTSNGTFVQLHAQSPSLGQQPRGGLTIAQDGNLYGTADLGANYGIGGIFSMALPGPLTLSPSTLTNLSEGFNFSLQVASMSGGAAPYTVSINWGDGTTSAGTTNGNVVGGAHTWVEETPSGSPDVVKVTVTDATGQSVSVTDSAAVADAGINAALPTNQTATEGVAWSGALEAFTDTDPGGVVGDYVATIDWGDGSPVVAGTISGTGPFTVSGSHTYRTAGHHGVLVQFTDAGGASNYTVILFTIGDAALSGVGNAITGTEGTAASSNVATFTDANPLAQATDFSASITWGDGTTSAGTVSGSGTFTVTGAHAYAEAGTYATSITITDSGGSTVTVSGTATIADYALSATGLTISSHKTFSGTVASLFDSDPTATSSDYTATINWGDGTTSSMGTVSGSASPFTISGSHTYRSNGTYTVTVTVHDNGGATATATTKLTVH